MRIPIVYRGDSYQAKHSMDEYSKKATLKMYCSHLNTLSNCNII